MSNINDNLEDMINMFFKYGTKAELSVDEFLQFRKQAISEKLSGITEKSMINYGSEHHEIIKPQSNKELLNDDCYNSKCETSQDKPDIETHNLKDSSLNHKDICQEVSDVPRGKNEASVDVEKPLTDTESDAEENGFTEEDFLKMMREVED